MRQTHSLKLIAASVAAGLIATAAWVTVANAAGGPNLASGKTVTVSSTNAGFGAGNLNDGNQGSYWESANNAFPQWAQVDLGASTSIDQVILKLPGGWGSRTQTLSVQSSQDATSYATIVSSAGQLFAQASSNVVVINFTATSTRYVRIHISANTGWPAAQLAELEVYGASTSTGNLALGKSVSASAHSDVYGAANANDGNQGTYWESANNAFPQWLRVDLGATVSINKVVLKLPTSGWGTRTQTLSVQGSATGSSFSDIVAPAGYTFDPASANTVTINFNATSTRYVRLHITANTAWPAGQISEFEVYGPGSADTTPPSVPGTVSYTQPTSTTIQLTWGASTDTGGSGLAGYDVYRNDTLATSVGAGTTTWTDTQPATATVSYYVRARDGAGNQSANSNTVTRTGTTTDATPPTTPGTLSYTQPNTTTIQLNWGASTDTGGSGLAGYDVYRDGSLAATLGTVTTWSETQPQSATVSYYVRARDGAGNLSGNSNTVTRTGTTPPGQNLALAKTITATSFTFTYVATNANDGNLTTYWEGAGGSYPQDLTVALGANSNVTSVVVKLNPDPAWGTRSQTIQVLGRAQSSGTYTNLVSAQSYTFTQGSNSVSIPVTATVADVQLRFTTNSGAPAGQVAEFEVYGTPAPNPDLTITGLAWSPASPIETNAITLSAVVANVGELTSGATTVGFYLDGSLAGTANIGSIAGGGSTTVILSIGTLSADSYQVNAKVDETNAVIEKNEANNSFTAASSLVVAAVQSSDIVPVLAYTPSNPAAGNTVTFTVAISNQGNVASAGGAHGITLTVLNDQGGTVTTRTGSFSGVINAGTTSSAVSLGTWTAANGRHTVRVVLANDGNEVAVKQGNNTSNTNLFVGRGANMPYDMYEAEDGTVGGGAQVIGPNRTIGDLAGEASGRKAVTLNSTGAYVQWTTKAPTNTLVTRFSIPDAAGGGGITSTLNIYVNGSFHKTITLTSKYIWLYGNESAPSNSPSSGAPRHIYDEANIMLDSTFPAGSTIRLQKDASNTSQYAIDFVNLEQVAPIANPDPARYVVPAGTSHQQVQTALDQVRMDTTGGLVGVYLPAGTYETSNKFQIYGKAVQVVGAGVWYTRFQTPPGMENTDAGFAVTSTASGSTFKHLAFFGNYTSRIDGPGKVWGELQNVANLTIDDVWVEHTVCAYWGVKATGLAFKNSRLRNTFADAINMTNESTNNLVSNNDARSNGDDAFALFSAIDAGGAAGNHGNVFENLSATLTWRAAGVAVYGGYDNVFRNLYIADMLTYSGITISSLDFGYPFVGFGTTPTRFENISLVRAGGHFWGAQVFGAIWCFSASKEFRGIRVSDVDIIDPTYGGVMFQTKYNGGPENPVTDTIFTDIRISGAQLSGDQFNAKSGWGIWANELPEADQGPAVGSATFTNVTFANNHQNIRNTTTTFTIIIN